MNIELASNYFLTPETKLKFRRIRNENFALAQTLG